ncbi:L-serine ammonia-lyase [Microbacterium sp.]|uniref:L-serine ammonia-lyase n=1 Tax=Microbacterium sp. TaxID=51671 RepID=UPI0035AD8D3C
MTTIAPVTDARSGVYVSAFELFSIGIGPSSSHTVGPMRAGRDFARRVLAQHPHDLRRVEVVLYGSLAATGLGHGTPDAVVAGLAGMDPETCDPASVRGAWSGHRAGESLPFGGVLPVPFDSSDVVLDPFTRPRGHPNTLLLRAFTAEAVVEETYLSVGGGFIQRVGAVADEAAPRDGVPVFRTAAELLALCVDGRSIADVARTGELASRRADEVAAGLDAIWDAMRGCIESGLDADGTLPGRLGVPRRARAMRDSIRRAEQAGRPVTTDWLQAFALAVNEENAGGGRVVTAPTNGAAGILPAVLMYYVRFEPGSDAEGVRTFLLTAAAIGSIIRANASISGAEGGCQAEVGSACAMAAAGLCAVLGGTPAQVENAAEIAMEHHLGLTCDPVAGLVQIPCIERNAVAASTAVTAARLALHGDGRHVVSLDAVIETMRQTGADMSEKYKETSRGGLAVNVVEC